MKGRFKCLLQPKVLGSVGLIGLLLLAVVYLACPWVCPWLCLKVAREDIYHFALFFGGGIGLLLAYWRSVTGDKNLKQEKYRLGAELLDTRNRDYSARVAGATTLADLAVEDPEYYGTRISTVFAAFLAYPPCYSRGPKHGKIDFQSQDTVVVREALNKIIKSGKSGQVFFPEDAPFIIEGDMVICNQKHPDHPDYKTPEPGGSAVPSDTTGT